MLHNSLRGVVFQDGGNVSTAFFFYKKLVREKVGIEKSKHVLEVEGWKLSYSEMCEFS